MKTKQDLSLTCNLDDEDMANDCWNCSRFLFPIGCMCDEDNVDKWYEYMVDKIGKEE